MNCGEILAGDTGVLIYNGMAGAGMSWTYAGNVAGGTFVILPDSTVVVGIAVGAEVGTSLASCKALGTSISGVTFKGVMSFVKV